MIWVMDGADQKDVVEALKTHNQMLSPKYRIAENIAEQIMDEFKEAGKVLEINYRDIVRYLKKNRIPVKGPDVAELVARYLNQEGMKVWR